MAAGLLSFGPGLVTKGHHRKNGIWLEARNQLVFVYQQDAKSASRFSGGDLFVTKGVTSRGLWFRGLFLEHCFVTNEAPFRFPVVILVPFEPQKRDLQVWNGLRASNMQGS